MGSGIWTIRTVHEVNFIGCLGFWCPPHIQGPLPHRSCISVLPACLLSGWQFTLSSFWFSVTIVLFLSLPGFYLILFQLFILYYDGCVFGTKAVHQKHGPTATPGYLESPSYLTFLSALGFYTSPLKKNDGFLLMKNSHLIRLSLLLLGVCVFLPLSYLFTSIVLLHFHASGSQVSKLIF